MSAKHTPKAGDEVYNLHGEMGLYVAAAKGGGYIVQPLIDGGNAETQPDDRYVDGVALWTNVYRQPPSPMLDEKISEQEARLALLRGEVRSIEAQKRQLEADERAMKERRALHVQLTWIDDLLAGRFTHYLVKESDYSDFWIVKTAEDFRKDRNHSQVRLQLWVSTHERGESFAWKVIAGTSGDRFDGKSCGVIPFKTEAEAIARRNEFLAEILVARVADHYNAGSHRLRDVVNRCQGLGMEVPADALEDLRQRELREALAEAEKTRLAVAAAEQRLAALKDAGVPA